MMTVHFQSKKSVPSEMASNRFNRLSSESSKETEFKQNSLVLTLLENIFTSLGDFVTYILSYLLPGESCVAPDESNFEAPTDDQPERAKRETERIMKDLTGDSKGFPMKFLSSGSSKSRRIPRLYYINNNQSVLIILQGDITKTKVDAIVNAANEHMTGGSGVDGMVHRAAGDELYDACKAHKQIFPGVRLPTGHSRILLSYNMGPHPYHIINTAGPMYYRNEAAQCAKDLSSCYKTALTFASLYDLESIGFTAISCGIFGYPADDGADVALQTVNKCAGSVPVVVFVLWDDHIYDAWYKKVEELHFPEYDPNTPITEKPAKSNKNDGEEKTIQTPTNRDAPQQTSTSFNPTVIDVSTSNTKHEKSGDEVEDLVVKLPAVPSDTSDTQPVEDMDHGNTRKNSDSRLTTQGTASMADVDSQQAAETSHADSRPSHTAEGNKESSHKHSKTEATDHQS